MDGDRGRVTELFRARRIVLPEPTERHDAATSERSRYQQPRSHKLTADQEQFVLSSPNQTLRELAQTFDVSPETVRNIRKRGPIMSCLHRAEGLSAIETVSDGSC